MSNGLGGLLAKSQRKPHGAPAEQLTTHLGATLDAARLLQQRVGDLVLLPEPLRNAFWTGVAVAAFLHDAGKVMAGFQAMVAGRVRSWGQRHEVVSLGFLPALLPDPALRPFVAVGVVTHHRALTANPMLRGKPSLRQLYGALDLREFREEFGDSDAALVQELADWLADQGRREGLPLDHPNGRLDLLAASYTLLQEVLTAWARTEVSPADGLAGVLVQGAVTLADHLSSAHGELLLTQPLNRDFPARLHRAWLDSGDSIRPHQQAAEDTDGHVVIRGSTGSGKTEAGLLWAARQTEAIAAATSGTPRVFYTLPYLASINAMADRLGRLLDAIGSLPAGDAPDGASATARGLVGVSHSKAGSYYLAAAVRADDDQGGRNADVEKAVARAAATRLFRESVRVGTPYQLLRGALAGPAHSSALVDMANSVFLLDELHAYDPKRLGFILAMIGFWRQLGGRVGVLSATLPQALIDLLTDVLGAVRVVDGRDHGLPARHRLRLRHQHLTDPASLEEMRQILAEEQSLLVVANNVKDAQAIYQELAPIARERYGVDAAQLLHARFRRMDRSRIERHILARYGTEVGERRPGLVVATQTVEVSLDVDFDVLHTGAATLEALLQRFGRVNRIAERPPADVVVHQPVYGPRRRGGPEQYADGVYPQEPVEAAWNLLTSYDSRVIEEQQATAWLDEIYATPWGTTWRQEVIAQRDLFTRDFLTFSRPFDDREPLAEEFDRLFEGTEAILASDRDAYAAALTNGTLDAGRLQAEEYLIPLPAWMPTTRDANLGVRILDADYDGHELGLQDLRDAREPAAYALGVML